MNEVKNEYVKGGAWGNTISRAINHEERKFTWHFESGSTGQWFETEEEARQDAPVGAQIVECREIQIIHGVKG